MYPPLKALRQAGDGQKIGTDLWLIAMALFIISSLLGGLNYISTILNMRTKGMSMTRMPLPIWAMFFTAVLGVLSFPVLLSGAILLLFDRNLGTSFYLSDIVINGEILPNEGGSAFLYQHLFWFLGHPEVYIILLPAMGMVSVILSVAPVNRSSVIWPCSVPCSPLRSWPSSYGRTTCLSPNRREASRAAPVLGQHTHEVLREVAGMTDEEIVEHEAMGVLM